MCGINGFTFPNLTLIKSMNRTLKHRGPDDGGEYVDGQVSLGSRRLSIIDLSANGHMPMCTEDSKLWIVFNGEIYNFQALRADLRKKGINFKSRTDTEVILQGYRQYGRSFISRLNGMFAFAIWDKDKQELILARDRIGIKPLYYTSPNNQLIFSSEIKALLTHRFSKRLDPDAINLYFRLLYIPSPYTIFESVKKLAPGHLLVWKAGRLHIHQYWQPVFNPATLTHSQVLEALDTNLNQAVKSNLISDRPVGVFLSGGIDSSLVLALASRHSSKRLHTYTAGFVVASEQEKYNQDLINARISSQYFHTLHHEVMITAADMIKHTPKVIYHLDEPISNPNHIALFMLSRAAQKDVTVILGGDGGDELFAGYTRYLVLYYLSLYNHLPSLLKTSISRLLTLHSKHLGKLLAEANTAESSKLHTLFMSQPEAIVTQILRPQLNDATATPRYFNAILASRAGLHMEEFLMTDLQTWLPEESLIKSDKLSMANSIEQRVPLLNNEVVDLALAIPFSKKIYPRQTKILLRRLAGKYLPPELIRAPKWGFFSPVSKWFRGDLKEFVADWIDFSDTKDYVNQRQAKKIFKTHLSGGYHPHTIWSVVTFNCWYQSFMSRL